jgi:hypothetical protein
LWDDECAQHVADAVSQVCGFHANGAFTWHHQRWLHVGWTEANQRAYAALTAFCLATGRRWITSYARDGRATLDTRFFTTDVEVRAQRLRTVFGPPTSDVEE